MSDRQTMKEHLLRDLHIDTLPSGSEAGDDVDKAIIESIRYNRKFLFTFNQAKAKLRTVANSRTLSLPVDFLGLITEPYIQTSEDAYNKRKLVSRTLDWIEENEWRGTEWETAITTGEPRFYAMDPSNKTINLVPIPQDDGELITFTYHKDPGTPTYKYTGSAWAFYTPFTDSETLAATYTNEWFKEGYHLVYNRAAYLLWTRVFGGTEEASIRAAEHLKQWAEEVNSLRAEGAVFQAPTEIRRWI